MIASNQVTEPKKSYFTSVHTNAKQVHIMKQTVHHLGRGTAEVDKAGHARPTYDHLKDFPSDHIHGTMRLDPHRTLTSDTK